MILKETRTLTRFERIVETWEEVQIIHSRTNMRGEITESETEVRRRFVLVETNIATVAAFYNGIPFPNIAPFGLFLSFDGPERARKEAESFCLKYGIKPSDPLVLNVQTWTRREEWAETMPEQYKRNFPRDSVIYYRTDTPRTETDRTCYWASNSQPSGWAAGDRCQTCQSLLKFDPGHEQTLEDPSQPPCVFCPYCGIIHEPIDWTRVNQ